MPRKNFRFSAEDLRKHIKKVKDAHAVTIPAGALGPTPDKPLGNGRIKLVTDGGMPADETAPYVEGLGSKDKIAVGPRAFCPGAFKEHQASDTDLVLYENTITLHQDKHATSIRQEHIDAAAMVYAKKIDQVASAALHGDSGWLRLPEVDLSANGPESEASWEEAMAAMDSQRAERRGGNKRDVGKISVISDWKTERLREYSAVPYKFWFNQLDLRNINYAKVEARLIAHGCPNVDALLVKLKLEAEKLVERGAYSFEIDHHQQRMLADDLRGVETQEQTEPFPWLHAGEAPQEARSEGRMLARITCEAPPLPGVSEQAQALVAAADTVRGGDDPADYAYYEGIFGDEAIKAPEKKKERVPLVLYGRGRPGRQYNAQEGDTYTDNADGCIYTFKNFAWKVTGALSTNPNSPERQGARNAETRQKATRK